MTATTSQINSDNLSTSLLLFFGSASIFLSHKKRNRKQANAVIKNEDLPDDRRLAMKRLSYGMSLNDMPRRFSLGNGNVTNVDHHFDSIADDMDYATKTKNPCGDRSYSDHYTIKGSPLKCRNGEIMPRTVTLIRHGESEGNVNADLFQTKPDSMMKLTELGWAQARMAGKTLREQIIKQNGKNSIHFIVSPYVRTMETFHAIASAWCDPDKEFGDIEDRNERLSAWYERLAMEGLTWLEDPRIREQDFGNYQDAHAVKKAQIERRQFGAFYYRFLNGESGSDVFDRVSTFFDSLWRSFHYPDHAQNYVLVTHGISIRVLLARYFHYSIDQFHMMKNPTNCEMVILQHDGEGKLQLNGRRSIESEDKGNSAGEMQPLLKYKFYETMAVVPKEHFRPRVIRMTPNETS